MAIRLTVHLKTQSQPIAHNNVLNTYQKGDFYCVYVAGAIIRASDGSVPLATGDEKTYKYPIGDIFRVIEEYGFHGRPTPEV